MTRVVKKGIIGWTCVYQGHGHGRALGSNNPAAKVHPTEEKTHNYRDSLDLGGKGTKKYYVKPIPIY